MRESFKKAAATGVAMATLPLAVKFGAAAAGISFGMPLALAGLAAVPPLWWVFRRKPQTVKTVQFPLLGILDGLTTTQITPASFPVWQKLMRLLALSLMPIAAAAPQLHPEAPAVGTGPLLIVLDDGWSSAHGWPEREAMMKMLIGRAEQEGRPVTLVGTAPDTESGKVTATRPMTAAEALRAVQHMAPLPWPTDHAATLEAVKEIKPDHMSVFWLSDGLDDANAVPLAQALHNLGTVKVVTDAVTDPKLLAPAQRDGTKLAFTVRRPAGGAEEQLDVILSDLKDHPLIQTHVTLPLGELQATATFDLPRETLNEVAQATIPGENTAGATVMLDERWHRRAVGVLNESGSDSAEPLLIGSSYASDALEPYVDLRRGGLDDLLKKGLSVLIVTDGHILTTSERATIDTWVKQGGTLLRFAGPNLAENPTDDLLPVKLDRQGPRTLDGGAMSWNHPAKVAPFPAQSPFADFAPEGNVTVREQVLADPSAESGADVWATLEDGTPLVTAASHGKGRLVLVHTTANDDWSNLALSGMFVEMLRAVVTQSLSVSGASESTLALPPIEVLDGQGRLGNAPKTVLPLPGSLSEAAAIGPRHPPGLYGNESTMRAINLTGAVPEFKLLKTLPAQVQRVTYSVGKQKDLRGPFIVASLALLLADMAISFAGSGPIVPVRKRNGASRLSH
jgi:hypothetical protein